VSSKKFGSDPDSVIKCVSALAIFGGITLWALVPNGSFRKPRSKLQLNTSTKLFKISGFRKAAFAYFGHMWEWYAFWAFTPLSIQTFNQLNITQLSVALWIGIVIACGGLTCILGGFLSAS
jgi:hypothetical protein